MDPTRFDTLTRSLTARGSRRRALAGALAGGLGAFGIATTEAKKKKKDCPPCKKRKKGKCKGTLPDGTGCTGGTCQGGSCVAAGEPAPCIPQDPVALCADGCGTRTDNCGRPVVCATCPTGQKCLLNGSCATPCLDNSDCPGEGPPGGCGCGTATTEAFARHCVLRITSCDDIPQSCTSTAECPQGQQCNYVACGPDSSIVGRCARLCPCLSCPAGTTCQPTGNCAV